MVGGRGPQFCTASDSDKSFRRGDVSSAFVQKNMKKVFSLCLWMLMASAWSGEPPEIRIGVLSHRGDEATLRNWSPTADYLSREIPEYHFTIVPLDFDEIEPAVKNQAVEFLLVNPGIYVNMEVRYRITRIATLNNLLDDRPWNIFGGVIFTRADRDDIRTLEDVRGKRFMAVDRTSLGGFQMAWQTLKAHGIDIHGDTRSLAFGGTHDAVVRAVLAGEADVGTVRTGILEAMSLDEGSPLEKVRILGDLRSDKYPFHHSTQLYPEWPFSKLPHTPTRLARRVAIALLRMSPLEPAAQWGDYAGWTIPLEYQPVHDLLESLHLPPYDRPERFTLVDAARKYWYWLVTVLAFLVALAAMSAWVVRLNLALERSRRLLERQHNLILDSVADGIYGVDLQGNATFFNKAAEEITGWKAKDLIGYNQHERLHHTRMDGSPHPPQDCPVYQTFRDGEARYVREDLFWRKDGSSFPVEYSSTPLRDEKGEIVGSVVVFRDISARKQAEEEARRHQAELAHMARLSTMGEMASGMAHELNQPLTAIATNADACIRLLESGPEARERIFDALESIGAQARRAGGIIQQLRQFVRKEAPEPTLVDLNQLVDEVLSLVRPELVKAGITVVRCFEPNLARVSAPRIQIDQVLLNLILNAIEAMSDDRISVRRLTLRTANAGENAVMVSVEDTGPGLPPEIRDKLFTPFVTSKPQGMGLGLSISQGIIQAHKGNLYYDDAAQGACFRFVLPLSS